MFIHRNPFQVLTDRYLYLDTANVIISKQGGIATAVDARTREIIVRYSDDSQFFNELIDRLMSEGYRCARIVGSGIYDFYEDVVIQRSGFLVSLEGYTNPPLGSEWGASFQNALKINLNGGRIVDDSKIWGITFMKNLTIVTNKTYDKVPIDLEKTLLYLDNVHIMARHIALSSGSQLIAGGSGGPMGFPVTWRNVVITDDRLKGSEQYNELIRLWYEGFEWSGGAIEINLADDIGWLRFFRIVGNVWAHIENLDMFVATMNNNKYEQFWIFDVDTVIERVEFIEDSYIAKHHITSFSSGKVTVYMDTLRIREVGPIMIPKIDYDHIDPVFGHTYTREGSATVSGDGSSTTFKLVTHDLQPPVTDPSRVAVFCTPASADAISASPVICYLKDDDGDGIYESIYAKFASAPASGTNNVAVTYQIKYVR